MGITLISIANCHSRWVASFQGPYHFHLHDEHRGPGIFSHMHDVKDRKVVERT